MAAQIHARLPDNSNSPDRRVTFQTQEDIYEDMTRSDAEWTKYNHLQFKANGRQPSSGDSLVHEVKAKTNAKVIAAVTILAIICLVLVAIALVMAGVTMISGSTQKGTTTYITNSSVSVESLESQISQLQQQLHSMRNVLGTMQEGALALTSRVDTTQGDLDETQAMLDETQVQLDETKGQLEQTRIKLHETQVKLDETERNVMENDGDIFGLNSQQISALNQLGGLTTTLDSLSSQQTATQSQLDTLSSSVNSQNATGSSQVHLYQNCYTDTAEVRLGSVSNNVFKRRAKTPNRAINVEGFYTLGINCYFESSHGHTVITHLRREGAEIYCYCTVINHGRDFVALTTASSFYLDCIMSVTRCPLTQTI